MRLIPAERLMSYEAWVPRGSWTGWPPHRHDGLDGSPYLEETYYYRFDRAAGFGIHRNFDLPRGLNDLTPVDDRSLVAVPSGTTCLRLALGATPGSSTSLPGSPRIGTSHRCSTRRRRGLPTTGRRAQWICPPCRWLANHSIT